MKKLAFLIACVSFTIVSCNKNSKLNDSKQMEEQQNPVVATESIDLGGKTYLLDPNTIIIDESKSEHPTNIEEFEKENVKSSQKVGNFTLIKLNQPTSKLQMGNTTPQGKGMDVQRIYSDSGKMISADFLIVKIAEGIDKQKAFQIIETNGGIILDSSVKKLGQYHITTKEIGGNLMKLGHNLEQSGAFKFVEPNIVVLPDFGV